MDDSGIRDKKDRGIQQAVLAEQVKQAYILAPFGIAATILNSIAVFFIMRSVLPEQALIFWLAAIAAVTVVRIGLLLKFRVAADRREAVLTGKYVFLAGLALIGMVWGSLGLFPLSETSIAHHVFVAFVLGGMSAGAAATFSVLKEGYPAYGIPALAPLIAHFFLFEDSIHLAMGAMLMLYGFLLWRISRHHYMANSASLLLRFENRAMVERLKRANENIEKMNRSLRKEINAKLTAESALRSHQERLEQDIRSRTTELVQANERLKEQIEKRRRIESALQANKERLNLAQQAGGVGVFDIDLTSGKAFWTEQFEELFGLRPGSFEKNYRAWTGRIHPEDRPRIEALFRNWTQAQREQIEFEYRFTRADGQVRWMSATARLSYREDRSPSRMIGTTVDSTERKRLEQEILHMVHHDTLTGLPNRRLLTDIINIELAQARRAGHKLGILFLDLDRFKEINDTFGHNAGDALLKQVSLRIRNSVRESDAVARIGGDEFNIILTEIGGFEDIRRTARKIMNSFRDPFPIEGHTLRITTSLGISVYPDDSEDIHTLFRYADIAMYHAKEKGRDAFQFYDPGINSLSVEKFQFEDHLRQTLSRGELLLHYQPQVDVRTGKLVAAEALIRWNHPKQGLLESNRFMPAAESIGFVTAIDRWVLKTACEQYRSWMRPDHTDFFIAVNVSARIFQKRDFLDIVFKILTETGMPPNHLEIEITESIAMEDIEHTAIMLRRLVNRGISISIDDFGTGYSSLNYLKRLPISRLKIDRSFVKDIATDPDDRAIIRAITAMAHSMKISVVAEGVETPEQMSFLHDAECDEAQGYLVDRPLPPEKFAGLLAAGR